MPSTSSVHEQLTDILVRVVGCRADAVSPDAVLADLGTDSLLIVEVGEELGRRFGVYLSDDTIDSMRTVQDAIDAVVNHEDFARPADAPPAKPTVAAREKNSAEKAFRQKAPNAAAGIRARRGRSIGFAARFTVAGLVIGAALGFGGAALVSASGLGSANLPPISAPTTPEPTTTSAPAPKPTETSPQEAPKPEIDGPGDRVSPGERFMLTGVFPGSDRGQKLQVEVRDAGEGQDWDDFPIQTATRDGGTFRTELYTSRTGEREFRVKNLETGANTPSVKVEIG